MYCKSASGQSVQSICLAQRIKENGVRGVCWVCKQSASSFRLEKASHPVLSYIVPWGNLELCYEQAKGSSCHTKEDSLSMSCDILSYATRQVAPRLSQSPFSSMALAGGDLQQSMVW